MKFSLNLLTGENQTAETLSSIAENPEGAGEIILNWWRELDIINKLLDKLPTIIVAGLFFIVGFAVAKFIAKLVVKGMERKKVDPSVYNFISRIISVSIKVFVVITIASMFFDLSAFVAALGGAGLAAGLGLQSSISQFASGIQILINHPFKNGDFVEVNGVSGTVADIRFMSTVINTVDNKRVIIPNSHITSNHIINYSAEDKRMVDLSFSISYSDDIAKAKRVILDIAEREELILKDPSAMVVVGAHEDSSIKLIARVWCKVADYWSVYFLMQEQVKLDFDKNGINIPFNQIDVHIHND